MSKRYLTLLKEAADIVGVKLFGFEWKKLKDITQYSSKRVSAGLLNAENYVGVENLLKDKLGKVDSSYVPNTGNLIAFKKDDVLIGNIRPYLRKIWIANVDGGTNGDVLVFCIKDDFKNMIIPRFLYKTLSSESFFEYDIKFSKGAKMPRGDKNKIMEYEVPLPSLPVQEYIVSILDKFDALINDISQGLPKEIELRQKQYEYYRERLMDFPRKN
ncbi:restriction endonuclease subunit S [Peptoniphilus sp. AGMB00490]|uniref:Restriction endonuclease subunit S n=2 Tax=Peptoniphilus TaxID=162289 RepID=A0ACD6AZX8_9FIRM|nr:restriction endonuclease subunit S [Peptoniphilus faecalis]NMW85799.1 restriction endonuclease subunit S [Peptoniphilus faecalis]OLR65500.1 restriction endonuclease subunit S [Peptoniphilus porci]